MTQPALLLVSDFPEFPLYLVFARSYILLALGKRIMTGGTNVSTMGGISYLVLMNMPLHLSDFVIPPAVISQILNYKYHHSSNMLICCLRT